MKILGIPETLTKNREQLKKVYVTGRVIGKKPVPSDYDVQDSQEMALYIVEMSKIVLSEYNTARTSEGSEGYYTSGTIGVIHSKHESVELGSFVEVYKMTSRGNRQGVNISNVKTFNKTENVTACAWLPGPSGWGLNPVYMKKLDSETPIYSASVLGVKPCFALSGMRGVQEIEEMQSHFPPAISSVGGHTESIDRLTKIGDTYAMPTKVSYSVIETEENPSTLIDEGDMDEDSDDTEIGDLSDLDLDDFEEIEEEELEGQGATALDKSGEFVLPPSASPQTVENLWEQIEILRDRISEHTKSWEGVVQRPTDKQLSDFLSDWKRYVVRNMDVKFDMPLVDPRESTGSKYLSTYHILSTFQYKGLLGPEDTFEDYYPADASVDDVTTLMVLLTFVNINPSGVRNVDLALFMENPFKFLVYWNGFTLGLPASTPIPAIYTVGMLLYQLFDDMSRINHDEWIRWASVLSMKWQIRAGSTGQNRTTSMLIDDYNPIAGGSRVNGTTPLIDLGKIWEPFLEDRCGRVVKADLPLDHMFAASGSPYKMRLNNTEQTLDDSQTFGTVLQVDDTVQETKTAEIEFRVYTELQKKGATPFLKEVPEEVIEEAERILGFDLSEEQRTSLNISLMSAGLLTGEAGSGKTTVLAVLVFILERFTKGDIYCVAPTGIASRRIKAALIEPSSRVQVGTMHSVLKLNMPGLLGPDVVNKENVLIIDETSMVNMEIFGQIQQLGIFEKMGAVYMFGDVKQLPPIGVGTPFRNLFELLPSIRLGISKRSLEGSGLYKNIQRVSRGQFAGLSPEKDFRMESTEDSSISRKLVKTFLKNYTAEGADRRITDLCIVTPYQTDTKSWGASNLNSVIQSNLYDDSMAAHILLNGDRRFFMGDRVVNRKPDNRRPVFRKTKSKDGITVYEEGNVGVVNGEVGFITKMFEYSTLEELGLNLNFRSSEVYREFLNKYAPPGTSGMLVEVTFTAYGADEYEYCGLYLMPTTGPTINNGTPVAGTFGKYYDLAYALTVHKLQGSTVKKVLIPVGTTDSPRFFNKNMLYTAVTRASRLAVLVGAVDTSESHNEFSGKTKLEEILSEESMPDRSGTFGYLCFYGEMDEKGVTDPSEVFSAESISDDDEDLLFVDDRFSDLRDKRKQDDLEENLRSLGFDSEEGFDEPPF